MQRNRELILSAAAVVVIGALYLLFVMWQGVPAASGLLGHSLGVLGFTLMLSTETLYSLRKRSLGRGWGRMSEWLQFHIFTGIVGPYLVFLHAAWSFRGLAGVVLLMTGIVVLSGFVGRYIYTAVPRTADGLIVEAEVLRAQMAQAEAELRRWLGEESASLLAARREGSGLSLILGRTLSGWRERRARRRLLRRSGAVAQARMAEIDRLLRRRSELRRQLASMAAARRLLAVWHSVHIPLGMALFLAAFVHAGAALYYATLLR